MMIRFTLNGTAVALETPGSKRVLDLLRDECGLTGTKEGCGKGECGACTILFDGRVANACLLLACQADGHELVTIEGLEHAGQLAPIQQAFVDEGAVQCGFCIPGMVLAAHALLAGQPQPTDDEIKRGLAGNLCRCTGYRKIIAAVRRAAQAGNA